MKKLFLCNTPYQVIVAVWLKKSVFLEANADIIISDHMNGYKDIASNISEAKIFDDVYTVESASYSKNRISYKSEFAHFFFHCFKQLELRKFLKLKSKYDEVFSGNADKFSGLLYSVLNKKYKTKFSLYEDGISTYSKLYETYYNNCKPYNSRKYVLADKIFNNKYLYNNISNLWVFNKNAMLWEPDISLKEIPHIKITQELIDTYNIVFGYARSKDVYDKRYIYFEESFYADTGYMEDVDLINSLAERVGKENIMIKIHPRNPKNRFNELGYKTNEDISIPWEIIVMNSSLENNVLITIGSQAIVSPCILFDSHIKSYSLYNCLENRPEILNGPLFDVIMMFYNKYDNITLCNSINEIE